MYGVVESVAYIAKWSLNPTPLWTPFPFLLISHLFGVLYFVWRYLGLKTLNDPKVMSDTVDELSGKMYKTFKEVHNLGATVEP